MLKDKRSPQHEYYFYEISKDCRLLALLREPTEYRARKSLRWLQRQMNAKILKYDGVYYVMSADVYYHILKDIKAAEINGYYQRSNYEPIF